MSGRRIPKHPNTWRPQKDDHYYYLDAMGRVQSRHNWLTPADLDNIAVGNCYRTFGAVMLGNSLGSKDKRDRQALERRRMKRGKAPK